MNKIEFHAPAPAPIPPVRIQADSAVMQQMLIAVLEPYFSVTEDPAPLTVLCPEIGKTPVISGRGKFLVICDEPFDGGEHVVMHRPLDLEQFLQTAFTMCATMDGNAVAAMDYRCDDKNKTVIFNNRTVSLTDKEYAMFQILWSNIGEVVSKDLLKRRLWRGENDNACQVYAAYLRKKLEQIAGPGALVSVRGRGYMLRRPQ